VAVGIAILSSAEPAPRRVWEAQRCHTGHSFRFALAIRQRAFGLTKKHFISPNDVRKRGSSAEETRPADPPGHVEEEKATRRPWGVPTGSASPTETSRCRTASSACATPKALEACFHETSPWNRPAADCAATKPKSDRFCGPDRVEAVILPSILPILI